MEALFLWLVAIPAALFTGIWVAELVLDLAAPLWPRPGLLTAPKRAREANVGRTPATAEPAREFAAYPHTSPSECAV